MDETVNALNEIYVRRITELHQGDVVYLSKTEDIPLLNLGDIYDFQSGTNISLFYETAQPARGMVVQLIKNPPVKKWYQFWIKQQVTGYFIQII